MNWESGDSNKPRGLALIYLERNYLENHAVFVNSQKKMYERKEVELGELEYLIDAAKNENLDVISVKENEKNHHIDILEQAVLNYAMAYESLDEETKKKSLRLPVITDQ